MRVKCDVCGKKFKRLKLHKRLSHPALPQALAIAPPVGEVEEDNEKDGVIERLLDILWMSLSVEQKERAIMSLQLDGEE